MRNFILRIRGKVFLFSLSLLLSFEKRYIPSRSKNPSMLAHTLLILTILFLFLYIIILYPFDTSIPMARRILTKKNNPITKKKE